MRSAVVGLGTLLVGCYELQPTGGTTPKPGTIMGSDITDAGRLALGGSMGPEIDQIEGRLMDQKSDEYTVAVTTIRLLRGGEQVWHGERIQLKTEYVSKLYERRFSTARSVAMGAAGLGAIAFIATRSLLGNPETHRGEVIPDTAHTQRRPTKP